MSVCWAIRKHEAFLTYGTGKDPKVDEAGNQASQSLLMGCQRAWPLWRRNLTTTAEMRCIYS